MLSDYIPEWRDLPIIIHTSDSDYFWSNYYAYRVTMRLPSRKIAAVAVLTEEFISDSSPRAVARAVFSACDRHIRPWLYYGRAPFPCIVLFPRLEKRFRRFR